ACLPMNQTRVFLIIAWLMVATLLWMEWNREQIAPPAQPPVATGSEVPQSVPAAPAADGSIPSAPQSAAAAIPSGQPAQEQAAAVVTVVTDVLEVEPDGGGMNRADLRADPASHDDR